MTYHDWAELDRLPRDQARFLQLEASFRESTVLHDQFDFAAFAGQKVLDIGCGAGAAACLFAKSGAQVTAIDLTETAVRLARANAAAQGVEVEVLQMDAEHLAFPDESFDFVFSWGVLHHSRDTGAGIREACRVLRPGGGGLIMVYNRHSLRYYIKGLLWLLGRGKLLQGHTLESVQRFFTDGYYHRHFTRRELASILRACRVAPTRFAATHMSKKMLPLVPKRLDDYVKDRYGWLLVVEFRKLMAS